MGHTVDGNLDHLFLLRVILIGLCVEIAVASACGEVSALIAHSEIDTIGLGFFHILVLAHSDGIIFRNQVAGCILGGNGYQRDHVFHLVIIGGECQCEVSDGVFRTHAKIVGGLSLQVLVA